MSKPNPIPPQLSEQQLNRFFAYIQQGNPNECWVWTGPQFKTGYGRVSVAGGRKCQAHRVAFFLFTEKWSPLNVCHTCDNPICMNPAHHFEGTYDDNNKDRNIKGRTARGQANGRTKLTTEQVRAVRQLHGGGGSYNQIGKIYTVNSSTIREIILGHSWAWLE